jgi:hypothetical protein
MLAAEILDVGLHQVHAAPLWGPPVLSEHARQGIAAGGGISSVPGG